MRFYSIQPSEMDRISNEDAEFLFKCIEVIDAKEALVGLKVAEYPYLKPAGQRKTFKDLKKQANPPIIKPEARAITMADLAELIGKG